MILSQRARLVFAATAAIALVAIATQVVLAYGDEEGLFATGLGRSVNVVTYFTILSNALVAWVCLRLGRPEPPGPTRAFAVLRLTSLISIVVTGVVYHLLLAGESDRDAVGEVATQALHTVVPLLAVGGWLVFGPHGLPRAGVALRSLIFPIGWLIFTLARGAIDGYYPYPFVDVDDLGYGKVALNCLFIALGFVALAFGALAIEARRRRGPAVP